MNLFAKEKALTDINRSASSFRRGDDPTGVSGFAARLVKQYGPATAIWAVERSALSPLQAGWVKRWISDNIRCRMR